MLLHYLPWHSAFARIEIIVGQRHQHTQSFTTNVIIQFDERLIFEI